MQIAAACLCILLQDSLLNDGCTSSSSSHSMGVDDDDFDDDDDDDDDDDLLLHNSCCCDNNNLRDFMNLLQSVVCRNSPPVWLLQLPWILLQPPWKPRLRLYTSGVSSLSIFTTLSLQHPPLLNSRVPLLNYTSCLYSIASASSLAAETFLPSVPFSSHLEIPVLSFLSVPPDSFSLPISSFILSYRLIFLRIWKTWRIK